MDDFTTTRAMTQRQRLLVRFHERAADTLVLAEEACRAQDGEALKRQLHRVKGDARMLGLRSLADYIELIYDRSNQRISEAESPALLDALERARTWLDEHLVEDEDASARLSRGRRALEGRAEEDEEATSLVMVVDDSPVARMVLAASLREGGVEVETLPGARETLAAVERRRPRVILTDVQMPGVDGFGLLERIRMQDPDLPVVLISGDLGESTRRRAAELGAAGLFLKSTDLSDVVQHVLRQCKVGAQVGAQRAC